MAYISFVANQFVPLRNYVTINGSAPIRVQNGYYKVSDGRYSVVVHGANGGAWECEGYVSSGFKTSCLSIRLAQDNEGNIVGTQYAVFDMTSQQEFAAMTTAKKPDVSIPSYSTASYVDDEDGLSDTTDSAVSSAPSASSGYSAPPTPPKKRGTGWIIFGAISLAAAFLTAEGMESSIACGVLGVISLLVGIRKKTKK